MMMNILLLLTESFPFGVGEQFLETEIIILSKYFKEISIFPLSYRGNTFKRYVPENVRVFYPFLKDESQYGLLLKGIWNTSPVFPFIKDIIDKNLFFKLKCLKKWLISSSLTRHLLRLPQIYKLMTLANEDSIIYFYWGTGAAWILPFIKNVPAKTVVRFHGIDLYEEREENIGYIPFQKMILKHLSYAIFISDHGKNYLHEKHKNIKFNSCLFRLGVRERGLSRGSDDGVFRIVSCSFLVPVKRIHLIIETLEHIDFHVHWTHIGDGPLREGLEAQTKLLQKKNITCTFLGNISNDEVMKYYQQFPVDLFLNVSEHEGVPVSIMEAISFGIPVFATDTGGTAELVDDGIGKLLPVSLTSLGLANEISKFRKNDNSISQIRKNARERWKTLADAERNYSEFCMFLKKL